MHNSILKNKFTVSDDVYHYACELLQLHKNLSLGGIIDRIEKDKGIRLGLGQIIGIRTHMIKKKLQRFTHPCN